MKHRPRAVVGRRMARLSVTLHSELRRLLAVLEESQRQCGRKLHRAAHRECALDGNSGALARSAQQRGLGYCASHGSESTRTTNEKDASNNLRKICSLHTGPISQYHRLKSGRSIHGSIWTQRRKSRHRKSCLLDHIIPMDLARARTIMNLDQAFLVREFKMQ
jgi:hypothetical protein